MSKQENKKSILNPQFLSLVPIQSHKHKNDQAPLSLQDNERLFLFFHFAFLPKLRLYRS